MALAALAAIAVGALLQITGALTTQEQQTVDTRFTVRGAQQPPRDVLVVAIDDTTFGDFTKQRLHSQWPFPRRYHARVINTLRRDGARVIAVDIQFTEPTDVNDDNALVDAIAGARGAVLGTTEVDARGRTNIFGGGNLLRQIGAHAGNASFPVDSSGEILRSPLQIHRLDTVAWATAKQARPGLLPPAQQPTWIDWAGPPETIPTVSYSRVYNGLVPAARLVPVGAAAAYLGISQLLFNNGWIVPVLAPLAALAMGLVGGLAVDYIAAAFERQRVYDLFSRFVPDEVVKEVVAQADGARLGGVARVCTVMFCDLRGFTAFSSDHEPQHVIDVVNAYLDEMSDAILAAGGTLVAYMGDGILAVFGAPLEQPDHADRALAAALDMLNTRLPRFNAVVRSLGAESDFRMGIGLNSGTVISGQVGCERRLEYTTIGDTTNLASRIEGATKDTPYMLLFSDKTRRSFTQEPSGMLFVQETVLRGSSRPVKLWTMPESAGAGGDQDVAPVAAAESPAATVTS